MGARLPRFALLFGVFLAAAAAPAADAQKPTPADPRLEQAKEESGLNFAPAARLTTPVGRVRVVEPELLAAQFGQKIRVELTLDRDVAHGSVRIGIPRKWRTRPGGRPTTLAPRLSEKPKGTALQRKGGGATVRLDGASRGAKVQLEIEDRGIPAGTHRLPVVYVGANGDERSLGRVEVRLYAPVREAREAQSPWEDLRAINVTNDASEESETFVTAVPGNPLRLLAGVNGGGGYNAWLTTNGGGSWTKLAVPSVADIPGGTDPSLDLCCDPMSAADAAGNLWYGGLSLGDGPDTSRITVSRIAAGTSSFVNTVGLPIRTDGTQDKPMMTIDNSTSSPTFGRLYVVWNEPTGGGLNIVMSKCDTRVSGVLNAARCDEADNWSQPVSITKSTGSYIYADVAVGPNGRAYVVWWDFSSTNAIRGATCEPGADCTALASWTAATTISTLDATGAAPLPFACPILAQPGGRASTSPQVETDISGTASDGRVYVTWSDLRTGSGTTRCTDGLTPAATHLTFDSLVDTASNALPSPGGAVRLLADGEGGGQANSDDWFAWLAVDQTTGRAYADFYSTRHDATRDTTHFYVRSVGPTGELGQLVQVSTAPSDYSGAECCEFGNDYGDYTGIDATNGSAFPIWSDKSTSDGEAFIDVASPPAPGPAPFLDLGAATVTDPAPDGDGDGVAEPGETLSISIPVTNEGTASSTSTTGTLTSTNGLVTFPDGSASYGTVGIGQTAQPDSAYRVKLGKTLECVTQIPLSLTVTYGGGSKARAYTVDTGTETVTSSTAVPRTIPDNNMNGVTSTLTMPAGAAITDLNVGVSATHTWVGDLVITLRSPAATTVTLADRPGFTGSGFGNDGDNLTGTIFDDEAAAAFETAAAPFTGRFIPNGSLSAFDGQAIGGTWTLTVSDRVNGDTGSLTAWSLRRPVCAVAPTADITGPAGATTGQLVQFDASGSADLDGTIANYDWDLDDNGSFETDTNATPTVDTTFQTPGTRDVAVRVTDNGGLTDEASTSISVTGDGNQPPTAAITGPSTANTGDLVEFSATGSSDSDGTISKYEWDLDGNNTFETDTGTTATASTTYNTGGSRTVKVRVTDDDLAVSTPATKTIVVNAKPTAAITGPSNAHTGDLVQFSATGSSDSDGTISKYEWDLDGNDTFETDTGTTATASTTYNTGGARNVKVRVTDDDLAVSTPASKSIAINVKPVADITGPSTANTGDVVQFSATGSSDSDGTIANYDWDLDGNNTFETDTNTTATASTTFSTGGSKTVRVRVTDDAGGTATDSVVVAVNAKPVAVITGPSITHVGDLTTFNAGTSSDSDGTISKYEWDLDGDDTFEMDTGTTSSASTTYVTGGNRTVKVRVTDDDSATATASKVVAVNIKPMALLSGPATADTADEVQFDAAGSTDSDGTIANYDWDLDGNGTFETDTNTTATASTTFSTGGDRTIQVRVTDDDGGTATDSHLIDVNARPTAAITGPSTANVGDLVEFSATGSSDSDGTISKYEWDLDGNDTFETDTGTTATASTTYSTGGNRTVKVRVTDDDFAVSTAASKVVSVNVKPAAAITGPSNAHTGDPVEFSATGSSDSDGTISKYEWDLDGNDTFETDTGTTATASTTYNTGGARTVKVRVTDDDLAVSAPATKSITINVKPVADITGPSAAHTGDSVQFSATGSSDSEGPIANYDWDLDGDNTFETDTDTTATASTTFSTGGNKTVRVRVTDAAGATATDSLVIAVNARPTAAVTGPSLVHVGDEATFSAATSSDPEGPIANYEWDLDGDDTFELDTDGEPTASTTYVTGGPRTVKVRVTDDDGATATATTSVSVNVKPTATLSGPASTHTGDEVAFTATASDADGTITNYAWDLDGDGSFETDTDTTATASTTYTTGGDRNVKVRVTDDDGATFTDTTTIDVNARPTAAIAGPGFALAGEVVDFDASSSSDPDGSIANFEWDLDGNDSFETDTDTDPNASTTFPTNGSRTIKVRVTDGDGATAVASTVIVITALPTVVLSAPGTAHTGDTVEFGATASDSDGSIESYEWDLDGDGAFETDTATTPSASTTYATGGSRTVKVRVTDDDGGTATDSAVIAVNARPTAAITGPASAVAGQSVTFDSSGSSDPDGTLTSRDWDLDGDGSFETVTPDAQAAATYSSPGAYVVKVRVTDDDGATDEAVADLTVTAASVITVITPPSIDPPSTTILPPKPFAALAGRKVLKVKRRRFVVRISGCQGCRGTLRLKATRKVRGKRLKIAKATYKLGSVGTTKIPVRLRRRDAALLRRARRIRLAAVITVVSPTGEQARAGGRLTIRR